MMVQEHHKPSPSCRPVDRTDVTRRDGRPKLGPFRSIRVLGGSFLAPVAFSVWFDGKDKRPL